MKNAKKILLLVLCAALLVSATIAGTVAYLTSNATVTNTFTVGKVVITMDESKVNEYGVVDTTATSRVQGNTYLLVPGHEYTKDPIIHVDASTENSYVFVQITNDIAAYIDTDAIETQLKNHGWKELPDGVWYQIYTKGQADKELEVFDKFTVLTDADSKDGWSSIDSATHKINVTAYAIQSDTIGTAADAWTALTTQLG